MTNRTWIGGHGNNQASIPKNWSPVGMNSGNSTVLESHPVQGFLTTLGGAIILGIVGSLLTIFFMVAELE